MEKDLLPEMQVFVEVKELKNNRKARREIAILFILAIFAYHGDLGG